MSATVFVTNDFVHMSEVAADIVKNYIVRIQKEKGEVVVGLATGNSPTGLYKHLARAANAGEFDSARIRSFNLDEYVGLPGENAQQRVMHRESYCYFMIQEFFSLLQKKFNETTLPYGSLIEQKQLIKELKANPQDWKELGMDAGRSIVIRDNASSPYLAWIKKTILNGYARKIKNAGGIDIQIIGVGGKGHVAFHESGIPFRNSKMLLVRLDDNTVRNAVADGHFSSIREAPQYAVSMGAELVYRAKIVVLLANGERKVEPIAASLLGEVTTEVPISYGQIYSNKGGVLIYVIDRIAARQLLANMDALYRKNIDIKVV
ncbi:MAG: 6-phosphogluconolactonase [Syntrophorhabdaceae bacterium]|nr:6-phosphogluconolactonase [Syntrophorhabdales bacterium]MBP9561070.1 6-phosphogluconolactonase [Syntrophorhabdaceae bacterium]